MKEYRRSADQAPSLPDIPEICLYDDQMQALRSMQKYGN